MPSFGGWLKHAYSVFTYKPDLAKREPMTSSSGGFTGVRPDRLRYAGGNGGERTIINAIYTRISLDASGMPIRHVRLDDEGEYEEKIKSGTDDCLNVYPNLDQGPRQLRQDIVMSLFEEGVIALVPVETTMDPRVSTSWDIKQLRVGRIVQWFPEEVKVDVYNQETGLRQVVLMQKDDVAIIENPLASVINEPSSTLQRILRKLNLLDAVDDQSGSGKLDLIIQLPYTIKSEGMRQKAEQRRVDIEHQLRDSKYGIAYTDGTEKITQLNRAVENNLMEQITKLMDMLYSQLGITPEVMNGTADEATMLNYWDRTIEPIMDAITEAMVKSFLTKTARTQGQSFRYFKDQFKLVPLSQLADIIDVLSRNEVAAANEIRTRILGWKPAKDAGANKLQNSNMPQTKLPPAANAPAQLGAPKADIESTAEEVAADQPA